MNRPTFLLLAAALLLCACSPAATPAATAIPTPAATATIAATPTYTQPPEPVFDGERALQDVVTQVQFGPRIPGSSAHQQAVIWLQQQLSESGWTVTLQETTYNNQPVVNIIAKRGEGLQPWIVLGAHYDSRMQASNDSAANQATPVPGANDGASGVAVLLELARVLPQDLQKQVWLVLFDSEDQGHLEGWDWIYGSRAFVEALQAKPDMAVIVDMIGDADLNIYQEQTSNPALTQDIWAVAAARGHGDVFLAEAKYSILDDHTPFLEQGIPAIDIIDFDYPYWHTIADTPDKVSAESLFAVGDTLLHWLLRPAQ